MKPRLPFVISAAVVLLLAGGYSARRLLTPEPPPPKPKPQPAPLPEKLLPVPADYRIVQVLASDTAAPTAAMAAAQAQTLRRMAVAGEGSKQPPVPGNFLASPSANGLAVTLSWELAENPQLVQIDRSGPDGVFAVIARLPGDSREFVDSPLPEGNFSYRARALGDRSSSPFGPTVIAVVPTVETAPVSPSQVLVDLSDPATVRVSWTDLADNEEGYLVERQAGGEDFTPLARLGSDSESFLDTGLEMGSTCSYRVSSANSKGRSDPSESLPFKVERPPQPPEAPTDLQASVGPEGVELTWLDRSDNETRFVVERRRPDRDEYAPCGQAPANAASLRLESLSGSATVTLRVRAENGAGPSAPSNPVEVQPPAEALATFIVTVDPSGEVSVSDPGDLVMARMEAREVTQEDGEVIARLWVTNLDPAWQYEDVFALVEHSDAAGISLSDCDRGPAGCSVDEGLESDDPVGYQYTESPYLGGAALGAETEAFGPRLPVRDLWPACGSVAVTWKFSGVGENATLTVNLYGRRVPADFRQDGRFDPDRPLWRIATFAPGVADARHEPGAAENPTARPLHHFRPGEVVAVNVSIEAGDWMESQPGLGQLPDGSYLYWSQAGFALAFDPAVLRPLRQPVVLGSGAVLYPWFRDPYRPPYSLFDGWGVIRDLLLADYQPEQGLARAVFNYPLFSLMPGADGNPACAHCFLEGFSGLSGMVSGPDPDDDARLTVLYFEVTGDPGTGSALRLLPWPETRLWLQDTGGTVGDYADDLPRNGLREVSDRLSPAVQFPGDCQVEESYVCVR